MFPDPKSLKIKDFTYSLPNDRIAKFPLADRSASKLLSYSQGNIQDHSFTSLPALLPQHSLLVFNNTKVVKARLFFQRPTGSIIEVFCLEPLYPTSEMQLAMSQTGSCTWKCLIGNAKRWKEEELTLQIANQEGRPIFLSAIKKESLPDSFLVQFSWEPAELTFADLLEMAGNLPLPPYLNRSPTTADTQSYQTVYAQKEGAVAAPTAGLHFTPEVLNQIENHHHKMLELTLHVGAGTFKPVKSAQMAEHPMHGEEIYVSTAVLKELQAHLPNPVIAVGTTSLRTLETIYWLGILVSKNPVILPQDLHLPQWFPYEYEAILSATESIASLISYLNKHNLKQVRATTQVLIAPGYSFKLIAGLITNFHQPESTLLLLVSALIGDDWRKIYTHALENNYRFLSYGDSSLLLP